MSFGSNLNLMGGSVGVNMPPQNMATNNPHAAPAPDHYQAYQQQQQLQSQQILQQTQQQTYPFQQQQQPIAQLQFAQPQFQQQPFQYQQAPAAFNTSTPSLAMASPDRDDSAEPEVGGQTKSKRGGGRWPQEITDALEAYFAHTQNPDRAQYTALATRFGMKVDQFQQWFSRRRKKAETAKAIAAAAAPVPIPAQVASVPVGVAMPPSNAGTPRIMMLQSNGTPMQYSFMQQQVTQVQQPAVPQQNTEQVQPIRLNGVDDVSRFVDEMNGMSDDMWMQRQEALKELASHVQKDSGVAVALAKCDAAMLLKNWLVGKDGKHLITFWILTVLKAYPMDIRTLQATGLGKIVKKLSSDSDAQVKSLASGLMEEYVEMFHKSRAEEGEKGAKRSASSTPSSSATPGIAKKVKVESSSISIKTEKSTTIPAKRLASDNRDVFVDTVKTLPKFRKTEDGGSVGSLGVATVLSPVGSTTVLSPVDREEVGSPEASQVKPVGTRRYDVSSVQGSGNSMSLDDGEAAVEVETGGEDETVMCSDVHEPRRLKEGEFVKGILRKKDGNGDAGSDASGKRVGRRIRFAKKLRLVKEFVTDLGGDGDDGAVVMDTGIEEGHEGRHMHMVTVEWVTPKPIALAASFREALESTEKDAQAARERVTIGITYHSEKDIPPSPAEPDDINDGMIFFTEPIPLYDESDPMQVDAKKEAETFFSGWLLNRNALAAKNAFSYNGLALAAAAPTGLAGLSNWAMPVAAAPLQAPTGNNDILNALFQLQTQQQQQQAAAAAAAVLQPAVTAPDTTMLLMNVMKQLGLPAAAPGLGVAAPGSLALQQEGGGARYTPSSSSEDRYSSGRDGGWRDDRGDNGRDGGRVYVRERGDRDREYDRYDRRSSDDDWKRDRERDSHRDRRGGSSRGSDESESDSDDSYGKGRRGGSFKGRGGGSRGGGRGGKKNGGERQERKVCFYWSKGKCKYGDGCFNVHEGEGGSSRNFDRN
ncbi:hypothetical protein HDU97_001780 [Phlyctochytrium planicorne]|nr:hypothetical protein HDU97_001780 [Phlyctochytrium planicorne]